MENHLILTSSHNSVSLTPSSEVLTKGCTICKIWEQYTLFHLETGKQASLQR